MEPSVHVSQCDLIYVTHGGKRYKGNGAMKFSKRSTKMRRQPQRRRRKHLKGVLSIISFSYSLHGTLSTHLKIIHKHHVQSNKRERTTKPNRKKMERAGERERARSKIPVDQISVFCEASSINSTYTGLSCSVHFFCE